jgi:hypothetical protein
MRTTSHWTRVAVVAGSLGALILTLGCGGARPVGGAQGATPGAAANATGLPIVVSCEPTQRTIVRPTVVNGTAMSQVECVAADPQHAQSMASGQAIYPPSPVAQGLVTPVSYRTRPVQPVYRDVEDTQVLPVSGRSSSAQPVRARQVVYDEPRRTKRSVKKSAVIIGSTAGIGAGLGAAIGGKKGALIGAAVGGGGATVWDQVTRRKN